MSSMPFRGFWRKPEEDERLDLAVGDLGVAPLSPSGSSATLHHRTGGAADNLIGTYII
jgi:hypothetical protein